MIKEKTGVHILLENKLSTLGYGNSIRALDLVVSEMGGENGFQRHDNTDFYEHLITVTQILINFGFRDEDLLTASLLHDIVEDVDGFTFTLIEREFGCKVRDTVERVTKKPGIDYKNNKDEMLNYLQTIKNSRHASLIKTADRMHNFTTLQSSSLKHRKSQLRNTIDYFIPFFKECREYYVRDAYFYYHAKMIIEPIAHEIGRYVNDLSQLERQITSFDGRYEKKYNIE